MRKIPGSLILVAIVMAGLAWKIYILWLDVVPFNSDEAVIALMARHILQGATPIFFYGQAYMGSLDAWLVALMYLLIGESILAVRSVQMILFIFTVISTFFWVKHITGRLAPSLTAAALVSIPTVNYTLYTTASLGGYGEALLLGNLIFLCGFKMISDGANQPGIFRGAALPIILGWLSGFGLWVHGITLIYSLPLLLLVLARTIQARQWMKLVFLTGGLMLGAFPWIFYGFSHGWEALVNELSGSAIAQQGSPFLEQAGMRLASLFLFGLTVIFGFRPPWEIRWLVPVLLPAVLLILAWLTFWSIRNIQLLREKYPQIRVIGYSTLIFCLAFVLTPFGGDPTGRYFLPFTIFLAALVGIVSDELKVSWILKRSIAAVLLVYFFLGNLDCAWRYPPGFTTQFDPVTRVDSRYLQELEVFLSENGETAGYSNYWVSYPLAFSSKEKLTFVPMLPYHEDFRYTPRDNRIPEYTQKVIQAKRTAYITTNHPKLDEMLRSRFLGLGIQWKEKTIGDYHIFFNLSRVVLPGEIGLGEKK